MSLFTTPATTPVHARFETDTEPVELLDLVDRLPAEAEPARFDSAREEFDRYVRFSGALARRAARRRDESEALALLNDPDADLDEVADRLARAAHAQAVSEEFRRTTARAEDHALGRVHQAFKAVAPEWESEVAKPLVESLVDQSLDRESKLSSGFRDEASLVANGKPSDMALWRELSALTAVFLTVGALVDGLRGIAALPTAFRVGVRQVTGTPFHLFETDDPNAPAEAVSRVPDALVLPALVHADVRPRVRTAAEILELLGEDAPVRVEDDSWRVLPARRQASLTTRW